MQSADHLLTDADGRPCKRQKRSSHDAFLPPLDGAAVCDKEPSSFIGLSDELLLRILRQLGSRDLVRLSGVTRRLLRLTNDPQLWKQLFFDDFVAPHSRAAVALRRHLTPSHLIALLLQHQPLNPKIRERGIRGLPKRFYSHASSPEQSLTSTGGTTPLEAEACRPGNGMPDIAPAYVPHDGLEWKALYQVSANWQNGTFAIAELLVGADDYTERQPGGPARSVASHTAPVGQGVFEAAYKPERPETIVQSSENLIFTAVRGSSDPSGQDVLDAAAADIPMVRVYVDPSRDGQARMSVHEATTETPALSLRSLALSRHRSLSKGPIYVSDIKVDNSRPYNQQPHGTVRLFVAFSSADWSIFEISPPVSGNDSTSLPTAREIYFHAHPSNTGVQEEIVSCAFNWPVLATCTESFSISMYLLPDAEDGQAQCFGRMKSSISRWPATLDLAELPILPRRRKRGRSGEVVPPKKQASFPQPDRQRAYRLTVAYCSPSYPANWSVSLQEVILRLDGVRDVGRIATSRYATAVPRQTAMRSSEVVSRKLGDIQDSNPSSTCRAVPPTSLNSRGAGIPSHDTPLPLDRPMEDRGRRSIFDARGPHSVHSSACRQPSRDEVARAKSISFDEGYLVVGSDENLLEVYQVTGLSNHLFEDEIRSYGFPSQPAIELHHRGVCHGHMGSVLSVAIEDGRCVSGSSDGSVMVWALAKPMGPHADATLADDGADKTREGAPLDHKMVMSHVTTLRSPLRSRNSQTPPAPRSVPGHPSTQELGRATQHEGLEAVKWVSTAFDRVLAISGELRSRQGTPATLLTPGDDAQTLSHRCAEQACDRSLLDSKERVHVWSFAV
ncbi:unnamed protein product [Parajaminaea phylloscopi]